jgi:hypothetical protein
MCVWRRGCERWSLLAAHASLLLLSRARLLSLAWLPDLRCSGGAATVGAGWMLRMRVSFSSPPRALYNTLAQPPLSMHSWYNSRRREVTEQRGGGTCRLQAAWRSSRGRSVAVAAGSHQRRCHLSPSFAPTRTAPPKRRGELERGGRVARLAGVGERGG